MCLALPGGEHAKASACDAGPCHWLSAAKTVLAVENIGRYQIKREIGKGAMGVVYEATDPNIGRRVALKTTRLDVHGDEAEELLRRFRNEAHAAGVLNHPNIVTIYDAGEQDGMFYIAMEYIAGTTLQSMMRSQGVIALEAAIEYTRQICAALDYAHDKGVIHRDIKPANIMITDGLVKIMDFGVAKAGAGLTSAGQIVGTPNYMSPEQVRGRPLDGRSDLFSLGVMLYEMITGKRPFAGEGVTTVIYKIMNETPAAPMVLDAAIHPGLSAVVSKALDKAPEQRFARGAELAQALENYKTWRPEASAAAARPETAQVAGNPGATQPLAAPTAPVATAVSRPPRAGTPAAAKPAAAPPLPKPAVPPARPAAAKTAPVPRMVVKHRRSPSLPPHKIVVVAVTAMALIVVCLAGIRYLKHPDHPPLGLFKPPAPAAPATNAAADIPAQPAEAEPPAAEVAEAEPPEGKPAVQAPASGRLRLSSSPAGAAVQIDGAANPRWVTPFTTAGLKPGSHTLTFSRDGFQSATKQVEVAAGKNFGVNADLTPQPAYFAVNSDPEGAVILVDNNDTDHKTPARLAADPGPHRIILRKEGFRPERMMVEVSPGQTLYLAPKLTPQAEVAPARQAEVQLPQPSGRSPFGKLRWLFGGGQGILLVRTLPRGAQISVDQFPAQARTPARVPLSPGRYHVILSLPGYRPIARDVDIAKGQTYELDEVFERE